MTLSKSATENFRQLAKNLTKKNKEETLKKIRKIILSKNPKPRTQTIHFSQAKAIFRDHTEDEVWLKKIKPDDKITEDVLKESIKHRDERKVVHIKREDIEKILNYHLDKNIFKLALFLLLTSGRRSCELVESKITNKKGSTKLTIDHIAKRRDKYQNLQFPTLVPKTVFMKNLKKFKKLFEYTNTKTFQRTLSRTVKREFGKEWHPHILRKIYAIYSYDFRNKENLAVNPFIQNVLLQQGISSSMHYTGIKLNFTDDFIKKMKFQ